MPHRFAMGVELDDAHSAHSIGCHACSCQDTPVIVADDGCCWKSGCWQGVGCVTLNKKDDLSGSSPKSELRDLFMTFPVPRPLLHHLRAGEGW